MNFYEATQNQRQEYLLNKWASRIADVEAVRRSEGRSFSTSEATRMAQLLESVDAGYRRAEAYRTGNSALLNESDNPTQTSNVAHGLKLQTFDLITGVYPNLIAEDLVSIQP